MIIDNPELRRVFSQGDFCEYCGESGTAMHCAHLYHAGMGGGFRLDVRINMLTLCWRCHDASHRGRAPTLETLLAIVAYREATTAEEIEAEVRRLQALPKGAPRAEAGY